MVTSMDKLDAWKDANLPILNTLSLWQWALVIFCVHKAWNYYQSYIPIPTYGGIFSFSRILSTIRLSRLGPEAFSRLYSKHPMILLPRLDCWLVYLQPQFVDEVLRAPDEVFSFLDSVNDMLQTKFVFGKKMLVTLDHVHTIQNNLTRHLPALFPEVFEEIQMALNEQKVPEDGWKKVHTFPFILQIVARASNRIFVGAPFCRNQEWLDFNINGPAAIVAAGTILNLFPNWTLPVLGPLIGPFNRRMRKARKMIGPMIEERLRLDESEWPDDFITWLTMNAPDVDRTVDGLLNRLLVVNFAAVHTSSLNLGHALYWLLARPKYIAPLREEIEETVGRLGWTKDAVGQMPKLESFMKECMRMTPLASQVLSRKLRKPFTFSNGVTLPAGASVAAHLYATHHDGAIYDLPEEFDGFRFCEDKQKREDGEKEARKPRQTMYTTSKTYLPFGHGRHACPGRFFAAMELKLLMAYMIVNYDMKWPEEDVPADANVNEGGYRPADIWFNFNNIPNQAANIMMRKRE